jgi:nucleoid-associated protein YgaU
MYTKPFQAPKKKKVIDLVSSDDESEDEEDSDKENAGLEDSEFQDQLDDLMEKFQRQWWDITSSKMKVEFAFV